MAGRPTGGWRDEPGWGSPIGHAKAWRRSPVTQTKSPANPQVDSDSVSHGSCDGILVALVSDTIDRRTPPETVEARSANGWALSAYPNHQRT
jgi:hypothetical protein